jgi:peptidylprolyl isomerase
MIGSGLVFSSMAAAFVVAAAAPPAPEHSLTMADVLAASKAQDWRTIEPENTLYMELDSGRVIIELAPGFAPQLVANIEALARAGFFDGLFVTRAQDNYVVQWGDAESKRPLGKARAQVPTEFERKSAGVAFTPLPDADAYAPQTGFADGFPAARDPKSGQAWLTHCYGMVGAGRDDAPDSGNGTELYTVIGNSPRHLDRNIALVGRIVQGIELLSVMPRGKGVMGFYEPAEPRAAIRSVRVAADVPESARSPLEALRTDTATFEALVESRRNRREKWFVTPAGHIDVCNVPLPVRPKAPVH